MIRRQSGETEEVRKDTKGDQHKCDDNEERLDAVDIVSIVGARAVRVDVIELDVVILTAAEVHLGVRVRMGVVSAVMVMMRIMSNSDGG